MGVTKVKAVLARALVLIGVALLITAAPASAGTPATPKGSDALREDDPGSFEAVSPAEHALGRIEIPRVGVSAPILEGVDDKTIRRAVGHFPETSLPQAAGNMALAAHRTTLFRGLRHIRVGDEITITSPEGAFRYAVERTWVVDPTDVSVLDRSAERMLTLVTCYPFDYQGSAPKRFIVRAHALPVVQPAVEAPAPACDPPVEPPNPR